MHFLSDYKAGYGLYELERVLQEIKMFNPDGWSTLQLEVQEAVL